MEQNLQEDIVFAPLFWLDKQAQDVVFPIDALVIDRIWDNPASWMYVASRRDGV